MIINFYNTIKIEHISFNWKNLVDIYFLQEIPLEWPIL